MMVVGKSCRWLGETRREHHHGEEASRVTMMRGAALQEAKKRHSNSNNNSNSNTQPPSALPRKPSRDMMTTVSLLRLGQLEHSCFSFYK